MTASFDYLTGFSANELAENLERLASIFPEDFHQAKIPLPTAAALIKKMQETIDAGAARLAALEEDRDEWERKSKNNGLAAALAVEKIEGLEAEVAALKTILDSDGFQAARYDKRITELQDELEAVRVEADRVALGVSDGEIPPCPVCGGVEIYEYLSAAVGREPCRQCLTCKYYNTVEVWNGVLQGKYDTYDVRMINRIRHLVSVEASLRAEIAALKQ